MRRHLITATTLAIAATALLTGCSGNNLEGTYLDAKEGRYMLILGEDGTCGHQERTNPQAEIDRSEEHTSELQSRGHLVCRLLLRSPRRATPFPYPTLFRSPCDAT